MFPLLPLWGLRSILQKKEVEQLQSTQKLVLKYTQISNGLIRTGDIVAELFQSKVLTVKEKDDIQHLLSTPVRANEQLLNTLMLKDDRAYDCFLKALGNTDQTHIAEILHCEDKYLDIRHCLMIQENYNKLLDNLDVDCGHLLDRLHEAGALKRREMESICAKPTKHEKSETLLALVSKFSPANFEKFLQALEESSHEHVVSIMTGRQYAKTESEVSTSIADKSNLQFKDSGLEVGSQKNSDLQNDSNPPLHHKQQKKTRHCVKRMEKSSIIVKRKSMMTMGSKFANLPDELQTDLSLKVATLHQKTVLPSAANVEICFRKLLTDFIQQKREVNRKQTEVEDMRDILKRVNESAQNSTHQFEDKFKTEIQILNEELLLHRTTNNRLLNDSLKTTEIELENEKQKSTELERQLQQSQNESDNPLKQMDERRKALDTEIQVLNEELLLHRTNNRQLDETLKKTVIELDNETQKSRGLETQLDQFQNELKTTVIELDNEKQKSSGLETQLDQFQNELKTTVIELDNEKQKSEGLETQLDLFQNELKTTVIELDNEKQKSRGLETQLKENQNESVNLLKQIDELRKELGEALNLNDESKKKFESLLMNKDEMVSELKQKLEQEMKVWADQKEQLMNRIQELQKEHSDEMASGLRQKEEQRMILAEEKEQLMNQIQELQQEYSECRETLLNLEEELVLERAETDRLNEQIQEYRRFAGELPYKSDPVLIGTIRTKAAEEGNKSIRGLAILEKELFVVSEDSSEIEVYDSLKFSFSRRWNSTALSDPQDIGSCNRNNCLYISNYKYQSSDIVRVGPNGKLILNWSTGGDYGSLSVTDESNVILAPLYGKKLYEYSPDGLLIRQISPHWPVRHCLKLTNGGFVVCGTFSEMLCIVNAYGKPEKSFDGELGIPSGISLLNAPVNPVYLSVDGNGFVLVADVDNSRVLLFDSDLKFMREILSKDGEHGIQYPRRILLDESSGRLFVADHKDNNERISIFSL